MTRISGRGARGAAVGRAVALLVGAAACGAAPGRAGGPAVGAAPVVDVVRRDSDRRVDVLVDGRPFTAYTYAPTLRKPVLYPVLTAGGAAVTRGWPLAPRPGERTDHRHQVGMWFTYGDVNGIDFWNNSDAVPDSLRARMGSIVHRGVREARGGRRVGTLAVTADWVDKRGRAILREETRFAFRALDGQEATGARAIERITTLTALGDTVRFGDNKEGLFGLRVARGLELATARPPLPAGDEPPVGRYRSAEGRTDDAVWGTRARWTLLAGRVGGEPVTLAILDHPENPGFPTHWHARGYGLFAANPLGRRAMSGTGEAADLRLAPGAAVTFRHQLLILPGTAADGDVEGAFRRFVAGRQPLSSPPAAGTTPRSPSR